MNNTTKNILIGSIAAIACAAIIIFSVEEEKSIYQIVGGFLIFLFPFTFLSSFGSKLGSFIFAFCTILIVYFVSKFLYHDFWLGVLIASIIGGTTAHLRVNKYAPFSPTEYKKR
jgi:hypothetical protein